MIMRRLAVVGDECVACGNCAKYCPFGAIELYKGMYAKVDAAKCRGCGKCVAACPADVMICKKREVESA